MSVWDKKRFGELEEKIKKTARGERHMDVPFYVYLYDPALERECLKEFYALSSRLKIDKVDCEVFSLAQLMMEAIRSIDLGDSIFKLEAEQRKALEQDLQRLLPEEISNRIKDRLSNKSISHCAILTRAGALFPFVHVSAILSRMEGEIDCVVVIPYPGNREGEMLNHRGSSIRSYYRGEII